MTRATLVSLFVAVCLIAALPPTSEAAFPGHNGEIAYSWYVEHGDSYSSTALRSICPMAASFEA